MRFARLLTVLCLLAPPLSASAQDAGAGGAVTDEQRAVEMFQISEKLYSEGRYDQALQYLQQAHALRPSPTLLYNMARTNEKLDRLEDAVGAYEAFLGTTTDAGEREQAELRIRTLRAEMAERDALKDRRRAAEPVPVTPQQGEPANSGWGESWQPDDPLAGVGTDDDEVDDDSSGSIVPWILIGAGVPVLGTGLVLYLVATGKHDDAVDKETSQADALDLQSEGEDLMLFGNVLVGVGAAVALTGGVLLVVDLTGEESGDELASRPVRPVVGPGYLGITGNF